MVYLTEINSLAKCPKHIKNVIVSEINNCLFCQHLFTFNYLGEGTSIIFKFCNGIIYI